MINYSNGDAMKISKILLIIFFLIFLIMGTSTISENIRYNNLINDFTKSAKLDEKNSRENVKIYEIPRKAFMREKPIYDLKTLGTDGDIFLTRDSPIKIPLIDNIIFTLFGGHAAIITDNGLKQIEANGMSEDGNNYVKKVDNDWLGYGGEVVGLRIKNAKEEVYQNVVKEAEIVARKKIKYNYTFIFNTQNSFYCTDLVKYLYQKEKIDLNNDGFATTTYDLVLSSATYIAYYSYTDQKGVRHIYHTI